MRVERNSSGAIENQILTEMVVTKSVLAKIATAWPAKEQGGLFKNKWANLIGGWCVNHYLKYNKPPRKSISSLFHSWSEGSNEDESQGRPDSTTVELIETFLSGLSKRHESKQTKTDAKYIIDLANKHFSEVSLTRHAESILADIQRGKMKRASRNAHGFKGIDISSDAVISVLASKTFMKDALQVVDTSNALIDFDKVGKSATAFFKGSFVPDSFVAFMGKAGVGKSFWLLRIVKEMIVNGHPVLYTVVGDMSQEQVVARICSLILCRPILADKFKYPKKISHYDEDCDIVKESREYKRDLNIKDGLKMVQRFIKDDLQGNSQLLRMSTHPGGSINAISVMHKAEEEIRQGFYPKAICIDYPDEFGPMPGFTIADDRMNIAASWAFMRSMGQRIKCNVSVLTQSDADSYDVKLLSRKNFTDCRKKLDKVTDMYGINQDDAEKERGVYRINCLKKRTGHYNEKVCLHVASCLEVSDPMILATM